MDQKKIGSFIAKLRHETGLTQEELGQKIGVTNKTVSRWETGSYMPNIEMLKLLSDLFSVSINELICGERLGDEAFRETADSNLVEVSKSISFSIKERTEFWKRKWKKDHAALIAFCIIAYAAAFALGCIYSTTWLVGVCPIAGIIVYMILRNRMMIYVEDRVYGKMDNR